MKTVVGGEVAAGASMGTRLMRLDEAAEIVVLERDCYVSFANCRLPYHSGGAIPNRAARCGRRRRALKTYVSVPLQVNSPRWAGARPPCVRARSWRRTRPRSPSTSAPARYLLGQWPGVEPDVLTLGLTEPWVRLSTTLNGPNRTAGIRQLEARSTPPRFTAYAHLILDMLNSNPMLFTRGDEAEEAWRIIDPVMEAWSAGDVPNAGIPSRPREPGGDPEGTIPGTDKVSEDRRGGR
jgi:hypothetical protein